MGRPTGGQEKELSPNCRCTLGKVQMVGGEHPGVAPWDTWAGQLPEQSRTVSGVSERLMDKWHLMRDEDGYADQLPRGIEGKQSRVIKGCGRDAPLFELSTYSCSILPQHSLAHVVHSSEEGFVLMRLPTAWTQTQED